MPQQIERQTIQFSVFYSDQTERTIIAPNAIADLFKQQNSSGSNLGLKLSGPTNHQQISTTAGSEAKAQPMFRWVGMGSIWRLDVSPTRTDIFFDINAYADTMLEMQPNNKPPQIIDVKRRLLNPLLTLSRKLGSDLLRLAMNSDLVCETDNAVSKFGARYMSDELRKQAEAGLLQELSYRTNILHTLEANDRRISCNRLVHAISVENRIQLVIDVNTVFPQSTGLGEADAQAFFNWASDWITDQNAGFQA